MSVPARGRMAVGFNKRCLFSFPEDLRGYQGYQDYFLSRRVWIFGFVALTEVLDQLDTWTKGAERWWSLAPEYSVRIIAFLALCAIAARTRNLAFHIIFVLIGLLYEVSFVVRKFFILT